MLPEDIMGLEAGFTKLQNNQTLNLYNMRLGIERTKKELLDHFGLPELMLLAQGRG